MAKVEELTTEQLKDEIARRLSEYGLTQGKGEAGTLEISLPPSVARTFKAHWTGYRLFYPQPTVVLLAWLHDGSFWSEGYISTEQPSYVLAFRKSPHKNRGTGAERPDDKLSSPQSIQIAIDQRRQWIMEGLVADEELIRYEDFDTPMEAIEQFFNYTAFYCLKAVDLDWSAFGYVADPSVGWEESETTLASTPFETAIDEGLKKSDILWLTPNTAPDAAIPCWYLYTKDKRLYVFSGEPEQTIPEAERVRSAHVTTRRKGRDAKMADFDAAVRVISAADRDEFRQVAEQMLAKRQSVRGSVDENVERWMRDGVILELTPPA